MASTFYSKGTMVKIRPNLIIHMAVQVLYAISFIIKDTKKR